MNIQEFYDSIDESYENVSSRMMGNQKLAGVFGRSVWQKCCVGLGREINN